MTDKKLTSSKNHSKLLNNLKNRSIWQLDNKRIIISLLILAIGLFLTLSVSLMLKNDVEREAKKQFNFECAEIQNKISTRLHAHAQLLRSQAALFEIKDKITREEWGKTYLIQKLERNLPGILGLGYSVIVEPKQLAKHEKIIRSEGFPKYSIYPTGKRDIYTAIIYLEPFSGRNLHAFGYDMFSESVRRDAMEKARDNNIAALSGKIKLVQEIDSDVQAGSLMYVPIYKTGMPTSTVEERRSAIQGWVYSPYRMNDLMNGILGGYENINGKSIHLEIYDDSSYTQNAMLYNSRNVITKQGEFEPFRTRKSVILFNNNKWYLKFKQDNLNSVNLDYSKVKYSAFGGISISVLLFILYLSLSTTNIRAKKLAEKLTYELSESEGLYRSILNASPDDITITDLEGQILIVSPAALAMLDYKSEEEIIGRRLTEFFAPVDKVRAISKIMEMFDGNVLMSDEFSLLKADGSQFYSEINSEFIRDDEGKPNKIVFVIRNITERKQAQELLAQTRENYETFFNSIDDFLFILDGQGNIIHTNKTVNQRLEYNDDELNGKSVLVVHPEERREEAGRIVGEMLMGKAEFCPVPLLTKSGNQIAVETRVTHGIWNGKTAIFGVSKDISQITLSEEKFSKVFYLNPSACGLTDIKTGKYVEVNDKFYTLLGFDKSEVIGKTAYELGILNINEKSKILQNADKDGKVISIEHDLRAKNGEIKHVLLSAENITVQDKTYRFTVVQDITEQKRIYEDLKRSEEKFAKIFNLSFDSISIASIETGKYLEVNESFLLTTGYSRDEVIGHTSGELNIWVNTKDRECYVKEILENGFQKNFEVQFRMKNNEVRDFTVSSILINVDGEKCTINFIKDVTESKLMADLLLKSNKQYNNLVSNINVGVYIIHFTKNKDVVFDFVSPRMAAILGKNVEDIMLDPQFTFKPIHPDELDAFVKLNEECFEKGTTFNWEGRAIVKGEIIWLHITSVPEILKNGDVLWHGVLTDITRKKEIELELERHKNNLELLVENRTEELDIINKELMSQLAKGRDLEIQLETSLSKEKEINDLKTKFIATVSHEFRTPLAALFSSTQMIQRYSHKWSEEKINTHHERINVSVNYITQLLDDVLMISHTDKEILTNNPEPLNIEIFVKYIFNQLQPELKNSQNITFTNHLDVETINIDKKLLNHILLNLLSNGIKYSPNGGDIKLSISKENKEMIIEVSDTGVGIPEDEIKYIFEAFYRTKNSIGINGSGLGLNITKRAVNVLGGNITLDSKVGEGTTFIIRIPVYE